MSNKAFTPQGKVIIVTGAASGIGAALVEAFCKAGAKAVVACDLNIEGCEKAIQVAKASGKNTLTHAMRVDASNESHIRQLIDSTENRFGPIDLFVANAGITITNPREKYLALVNTTDEEWAKVMNVNFMQSVYAARHLIPRMVQRGSGHFFVTASAAGLLTSFGDATYAVSKHAAVAFAEFLSIEYGDKGIGVTCLAPQGVTTGMTKGMSKDNVVAVDGMLSAEQVALDCLATLERGEFLVLPHEKVKQYMVHKAQSHDRWIRGSRKLRNLTSRI